jgi:hypothetical protein
MSLASTVAKLSEPLEVERRTELVFDGTSPRPSEAQTTVVAVVNIHMQRQPPTTTVRDFDGDESGGEARAWVTNAALAAAYDSEDEDDPPAALGWTELQIAPPQDADGPPADVVRWEGRRWQIVQFQGWAKTFTGQARFKRYKCADLGVAP